MAKYSDAKKAGNVGVQMLRDGLNQMSPDTELPDDVAYEEVKAGEVPALWVTATGASPDNIILHFHGGGGIAGSAKMARNFCGRLSRATSARVLTVDYRLGPEDPFPAGVDDAFATYQWLLSTGVPADHVIIAGESMGGNLTAVTLLQARDAGLPLPAAGILISPDTDVTFTGASIKAKRKEDPILSFDGLKIMKDFYLGDADRSDFRASPLFADLAGLPPMLIQVGTREILLDDSTRFAEKAAAASVDVQLDVIEGGVHTLACLTPGTPGQEQALRTIVEFVGKFFQMPANGVELE